MLRWCALALLLLSSGWCLGAAEGARVADAYSAVIARIDAATADPALVVPALEAVAQVLPTLAPADANRLGDAAMPLLQRAYASNESLPGMERLGLSIHEVQPGELPGRILKRYGMGNALMKLLNPAYDDRRLGAGQRLKVIDLNSGRLTILVQRGATRTSLLWRRAEGQPNHLLAHMPCGVGLADRPTPTGSTTLASVVLDPEWTHPDTREVIPAGDTRNVLGGYWLGLSAGDGTFASIGFHGYTGAPAEDWINQPGSRGCIRLLQPDIAKLYAYARRGVRVVIVP